jgi:hypothetical protein
MLALAYPHPHRIGRLLIRAGHQAAVRHDSGERGLRCRHHETLQYRMDAVRPDHNVGRGRRAVSEPRRGASRILAKSRAPVAGPHRARRELAGQQGEQIGPVNPNIASWLSGLMRLVVYAVGRLGSGSDVLGFDDAISRDHDWGCRLTLLVDETERAVPGRQVGRPQLLDVTGGDRRNAVPPAVAWQRGIANAGR